MGPQFRHYRLIRLATQVNREESCQISLHLRPHHVDTVQTNNTTPIWASFGGKKGYKRCERQLQTQSEYVITYPPSIVVAQWQWKLISRSHTLTL